MHYILCLRYVWELSGVPSHCVCGASFSANYAMICCHGGLMFVWHDELQDLTSSWLRKVCLLSLHYSPSLVSLFFLHLLIIEPDNTQADIYARVFGVGIKVHLWISGYFSLMHLSIAKLRYRGSLFCRDDLVNMEIMFTVWNQPHLHHFCFLPLVLLVERP